MKFIYKAALLICSSVFAMSVQAAGMPQSSKHAQRGVNCTQCHTTGKFEPVETMGIRNGAMSVRGSRRSERSRERLRELIQSA